MDGIKVFTSHTSQRYLNNNRIKYMVYDVFLVDMGLMVSGKKSMEKCPEYK